MSPLVFLATLLSFQLQIGYNVTETTSIMGVNNMLYIYDTTDRDANELKIVRKDSMLLVSRYPGMIATNYEKPSWNHINGNYLAPKIKSSKAFKVLKLKKVA